MKLPGWMRSGSQHPYALSFQGNIHACGRGIAGVPVAGFVWATSYAVRSDVLDSTVSIIFTMQQKMLVATLMTLTINVKLIVQDLSPVLRGR